MLRKIILAALLCLALLQTASAQYATIEELMKRTCSPLTTGSWARIEIYHMIPGPMNRHGNSEYYIVWAIAMNMGGTQSIQALECRVRVARTTGRSVTFDRTHQCDHRRSA